MATEEKEQLLDETAGDRPSACRIYGSLIGGDTVLDVDQGALARLLTINPGTPTVARENRQFMLRAARTLAARYGVEQFLDLGCAFPTEDSPNLHEVVRAEQPGARVVYVDVEDEAVAAWRDRLDGEKDVAAVRGAVQDPEGVLGDPRVRAVLDFTRPVALVLTGVFPFVSDADDPWALLGRFRDATCPGSYLVLSHALTSEDWPQGAEEVLRLYREEIQPMYPRPEREVLRFFEGYDLLEPGVVSTPAWRPDEPVAPELVAFKRAVAGVGRRL
ncbi:SAM-dependent methyltransferase [Streptomyces sp. NPDC048405]|uniref:SAM-dependent methyltransferase n=1 Tax=Streptomyces TaxID=1883 RepID=UPI0010C542D3|nr:SAM-dependent methyltransferase [Streptomyces sp. NA03103]QCE20607.1 AsmL [Streptomyces sp.]QKW60391.1 SAM-dependent methyltransferase [Streptomyces sp. NA03103]WSU00600.1 SAM-dependent methyltransferase [Streptomyces sp. NBC_01124]